MFSERLRKIRIEKGYTQEEIANFLGFTRPTYTAYESGRRKPDNDTLAKIAKFLNVSTDYLLGLSDIKDSIETNFVKEAQKQYGTRGKKQAGELLENIQTLFDGGELPEEDKDEFFRAITEIYFESKEKNKKYTPKKI